MSLSLCLADVNECELMLAVCGAALCENVEGSFLCLCASDLEEYDAQEGHCRPRVAGGECVPYSAQPLCTTTLWLAHLLLRLLRWSVSQDGQCGQGHSLGMEWGQEAAYSRYRDERGLCPGQETSRRLRKL